MFCTTGSHVGFRSGRLIDHKKFEANRVTSILKTDQAFLSDKIADEKKYFLCPKKYNKTYVSHETRCTAVLGLVY